MTKSDLAHAVLGLKPGATKPEIEAAYRKRRSETHPDRGGTEDLFRSVQAAYEDLMKQPCAKCSGTGYYQERIGAFVFKRECPICWRIKK